MKNPPPRIVILLVWSAILAILLIAGSEPANAQASKQVLSVPTLADLEARTPQTPNETIEVHHGSSSNRWAAPRLFVLATNSETADRVFVVTNRTAGTRYLAADRSNGVFDVRHFGAIPDRTVDSTAAITAAAAALQAAGGGIMTGGSGEYRVSTNGVVAIFTNISGIKIDVPAAFVTDDLGDDSFTSVALINTGLTATASWASNHGLAVGRAFVIKDATDDAFNGTWTVATSNSPTVLTFALTSYATPSGPATAIARDSDIGRCLFRFDACTNVDVGNLTFRGVEHTRDIQYRLGYRVIEVRKGTTKVRGSLTVSGASYGWYTGEYAVSSLGGCTDFDVRVWARSVGYPISLAGSGHDSRFDVFGENLHRGAYLGAVKRSVVNLWIKDWDVAGAIINQLGPAADNFGCEDLTLRVYDTGTTEPIDLEAVGGTRYMATISGYASTNEVRHRNLDIKVYGKNLIQTSGLLVQTLSSNHWIDGLTFGGVLDQSGIANADNRHPFFVYATAPADTAGQFRDIIIRDWKYIGPSDSDMSKTAYVVLANAHNDVVFDGYETIGATTTVGLGDGFHRSTVPRFPDWTAGSFEAAQIQGIGGGIKLTETTAIVPLASSLGSNDFTVQWVGDVPTGNSGLFAVTTGSSAGAGSFGASITNGNLIVRAYGASAADWVGVTATNWAAALRGRVTSLGIVRTATGVSLWTDGHTTAGIAITSGTPPSWSDALSGTNAFIGVDNAGSQYSGTVHRFAVFNYDRESEFPALAVRWKPGSYSSASGTITIDEGTGNGGFETLGTGGTDPFASWTELADGSSAVTVSTNAVQGTNSLALIVDGADSFAGLASSETMVNGATYQITFWARVPGGTSGQIAIVGAAGGDYPITITGTWARYSVALLWNSTTFSFKRWSLTGQTAEIDALTVKQVGALCDFDWTSSPADKVSGVFASPLGGSSTKVISRGLGMSTDRGDNSANLEAGQDAPVQVWASNLTGARTANLQTNHARRGDIFRIVRTGAGAGTLTAAGLGIATDEWADFAFNGVAWQSIGHGKVAGAYTGGATTETPDAANVLDFGAVGDGVTDDTAAIQAAIDSLPLPSTNSLFVERGGSVFIPAGIYKITEPLRMRPGQLEGSSRFGTVLINYGLTNDVIACMTPSNTPPTGIWMYRVAHMSIHQADATVPTAGAAIRVQSDDGLTASMADVEDVFIHGTFRGFHGSALQGSSLKNLTVYASKDDGILWDVYQTMVQASGCWTYYCGQNGTGHGWHLQGPAYCTVTASGADSNYGWGWYVESGTVQAPRGNNFTVGAEQNRDGGILIKNAIGGVYSPMVVTPDDLPTAADGIVVDNGRMVGLVGAFTQQGAIGGTGYPLRITNGVPDYPSVTVNASYLNSYNTGSEYHQTIGIGTYLPWEERGFIGLNTDGKPRRMLDIHDRTGAAGNTTGHELARLALHTSDTNGNAYISLSPDGETTFHRIIANNLSTNTVFNYGTNGDTVFLGPSAPLSGDNGSFLFQLGSTPVMSIKGGDTLGGVGIGTTRPNPAALLDIRSSTRGLLLPSWESTEYTGGLYGSGSFTPPGLLSYDSTDRRVRVQTRNATDGLTNNQYTTLFGYVDRDLRLGTAHRQIGKIWPQSVHATDTNIGSVYIYFTAENVVGLEIEQNSFRAGPFQYGTFGDTIIRNSYSNSAGAYGNLLLMAGDNASVTIGNGTARGTVTVSNDLVVPGTITLGGVARSSWPSGSGTNASTVYVEDTQVDAPNFMASAKLAPSVAGGTNVSFLPVAGSLQTNDVDATFHALLVAGGGAGDVTLAGTNAFTGPNSFAGTTTLNGPANLNGTTTISNLTVPGTMTVGSISFGTALGVASGGTGAGSAAAARTNLGLVIGYDVQAYDANLAQLATVSWTSGDVPYFDGSNLTNLATTAAGRTLLTAVNAAAQWSALASDALQAGAYDAGTWDGVTDKAITPDQFRDVVVALPGGSNAVATVTPPLYLSNGVLTLDTDGLGGGGSGYTYLVTNVGGAFQSRTAGTNWTIMSTTVSSNYSPAGVGRFLEGGYSVVLSNYSGTSASTLMRIKANGATIFQDAAGGFGSGSLRVVSEMFRLIRSSDTTAALASVGTWNNGLADVAVGDYGGASPLGNSKATTNITWNWLTNNTLEIAIACETSTSTNDALGMWVANAYLRAEGAASSGGGTGDVVGPASSTTNNIAVFADATGKVIADGGVTVSSLATEAEVAAGYQPLDADLTDLADGSLTGSKVGTGISADNITTGTITSNRLPAAVSFTTIDVGTINASAVVGDASGLTGINATNITAGELADARIPAAIARDSEVAAAYQPLDTDLTTLAINNGVSLTNLNATIAFASGTIPDARLAATIARTNAPTLHSPALLGDPTAPTASANDNDTSIATTAYVQAEETALKALNLWQATNAALTALAANPQLYQATNGNLTTLAGASITGAGNFMRTRTGVPREIWIPASAMNPGSDAPTPATNAWVTTTDGQRWEGWDFSSTATNSVYFTLALPTAWDAGTVKAKVVWKQVVAAATATNSWQIGGGSLTDGETGGNTLGTLVEVLDEGANDTNVVSVTAASGAITIGGTPSAGHLTWFTVRRHPGATMDNYAELSRLIGLHLQYTETSTEPSAW